MFRRLCLASAAVVLPLAAASAAWAHHSVSGTYDPQRRIEITGDVVEWRFRNPHTFLVIDGIGVIDGEPTSAEPERWEIESSAASISQAMGIDAATFTAGERVTVIGNPNRNPERRRANVLSRYGNFLDANGEPIGMPPAAEPELTADAVHETGAHRLVGLWRPQGFAPLQDASPLPLTEAGLEAWSAYDPKKSPANTCEVMSIPDIFNAPGFIVTIEIAEDDGQAIVRNQSYSVVRTIPLDGGFAQAEPSGVLGEVSGRIEGDDALVVESRNYPASGWGLAAATQFLGSGADVPSSEQKSVVERFSVSEDGLSLHYEYTMTDPVYLTEAYSDSVELVRVPDDTTIYPHDCDPEAASQFSRD